MKKKFLGKVLASAIAFACVFNASLVPQVTYADDPQIFEFEDGSHPNSKVMDDPKASGGKYVYLEKNEESISVDVDVPSTAMYDIIICYAAPFGNKIQNLVINGVDQGQISFTAEEWTEVKVLTAKLNAGKNELTIKGSWGWTNFDYVKCVQAALPDITGHDRVPCDSKATDSSKKLMAYLADTYGSNIISGQQEIYKYGPHDFEYEFEYIKKNTGKTPAIRGFDYLNCNPLYGSDDGTTERIIDWTNTKGGIATASWHITVPKQFSSYVLKETKVDWSNATYVPKETDFDTSKVITEGTKENEYYMWCLDLLAAELKKLQDADVPLIFRPLHEAEGGGGETGSWFWWGKSGSKVYKELWKLTYKTLTEKYDLHNLIWEWNSYAYETSANWYPGDEYVDIIAYDKYNCTDWSTGNPVLNHNDSAISGTFYSIVEKYNGKKMVAMAENDSIPTLTNLVEEKAAWLYFCPWYDGGSADNNFLSNPVFNKVEDLKEIYQSDYCITLDELPDLKNYETGNVTPPKPTEATTTATEETTNPTEATKPTETSAVTESTKPSETAVSTDKPETTDTSKIITTTTSKQTTTINADYGVIIEGDTETPMKVGETRTFTVSGPHHEKLTHVNVKCNTENAENISLEYTDGNDTFTVTALKKGKAVLSVYASVPGYSMLPVYMTLTITDDSSAVVTTSKPETTTKPATEITDETTKKTDNTENTSKTTETTVSTNNTKPNPDTTVSDKETTVSNKKTTKPTTEKTTKKTDKNTTTVKTTTKVTTTEEPIPTETVATNQYEVPSNVKATKYGDVNSDGDVNVADLVSLNMFLLNSKKYPLKDVQIANADCAKNGIINVSDSTILMNYIAMFIEQSQLGM